VQQPAKDDRLVNGFTRLFKRSMVLRRRFSITKKGEKPNLRELKVTKELKCESVCCFTVLIRRDSGVDILLRTLGKKTGTVASEWDRWRWSPKYQLHNFMAYFYGAITENRGYN